MDQYQQLQQAVPKWTVTSVEDQAIVQGRNSFGRGKRVHFRMVDGSDSYVDVTLPDFTELKVAKAIDAAADAHLAIVGLQSDVLMQQGGE